MSGRRVVIKSHEGGEKGDKETTQESTAVVLYTVDDTRVSCGASGEMEPTTGGPCPKVSEETKFKASQAYKNSCKPAVYVQNVQKIGFRPAHIELIRKTPFAPYVDMHPFVVDGSLLTDIIRCHAGGDRFLIAGKLISFTPEEAAVILGLPCHGVKISDTGKKGRLLERFGVSLDLNHKGLEKEINKIKESEEKEDIEDTVRLWIAYMFAMFLAPKSHQTCPRFVIPCLDDLSSLGGFAWAVSIRNLTLEKVPEVAECLRCGEAGQPKRKDRCRRQPTLFGCSAALLAWFFEHSNIRPPADPSKLSRLLRWYSGHKRSHDNRFDKIQAYEIDDNIIPSPEEFWLLRPEEERAVVPMSSSCQGCAILRIELQAQIFELRQRLEIQEKLVKSMVQKGKRSTIHSSDDGDVEVEQMEEEYEIHSRTDTVAERILDPAENVRPSKKDIPIKHGDVIMKKRRSKRRNREEERKKKEEDERNKEEDEMRNKEEEIKKKKHEERNEDNLNLKDDERKMTEEEESRREEEEERKRNIEKRNKENEDERLRKGEVERKRKEEEDERKREEEEERKRKYEEEKKEKEDERLRKEEEERKKKEEEDERKRVEEREEMKMKELEDERKRKEAEERQRKEEEERNSKAKVEEVRKRKEEEDERKRKEEEDKNKIHSKMQEEERKTKTKKLAAERKEKLEKKLKQTSRGSVERRVKEEHRIRKPSTLADDTQFLSDHPRKRVKRVHMPKGKSVVPCTEDETLEKGTNKKLPQTFSQKGFLPADVLSVLNNFITEKNAS